MGWTATIRADMVFSQLVFCPKGFTGGTVVALVFSLVDFSLVIEFLEELLDILFMVLVSGPDKGIIADVQLFPQVFNVLNDVVDIGLGLHALFSGLFLNLLPVFIGTSSKKDIIALELLKLLDSICCHGTVSMANV